MAEAREILDSFSRHVQRFVQLETTAGLVLIGAAALAMLVKNSPLAELYVSFLNIEGEVRINGLSVEKPLFLWVNDFQMAIFFFLVGLEIKREVLLGHLKSRSQLILPAVGAVGGVAVPALIYLALNWENPAARQGWAVPTATDIAFALGMLALVGSRLPTSLKIFLMTLAILDDLIAIIVIALFYTSGLSTASLIAATCFIAVLLTLNRLRVMAIAPYVLAGICLWVCVLKSGVHATLAGVVAALFVPAYSGHSEQPSPLSHLIEILHPWVAFGVLPLFAFVNAGVMLQGLSLPDLLESVPLGIFAGLVVGKPLGVFLFVGAAILLGKAAMPEGTSWLQLFGVAVLCGIGFTMSLFIGGLAFAEGGSGYARVDRLGVLLGSVTCAVAGFLILRWSVRQTAGQTA